MDLDELLNGVLESRNYYIYAVRYNDNSIDSVLMVQGFENIPSHGMFLLSKLSGVFENKHGKDRIISLLRTGKKIYTVFYNEEWRHGDEVTPYRENFITTNGNHTTKDNLGEIETF